MSHRERSAVMAELPDSVEPPLVRPDGPICATRRAARALVESRPDVSPTGCVYIDFRDVEAITSPFASELLRAWPFAVPVLANDDVEQTWKRKEGPDA
jgi:hypothetical protein